MIGYNRLGINGRFGNQLFQYSLYLEYVKMGRNPKIETSLLQPRLDETGKISILSFHNLKDINFVDKSKNHSFRVLQKFINFGSMMEYSKGNDFSPKNFYAITKFSFQKIDCAIK